MKTEFDVSPSRYRLKKMARRMSITAGRIVRTFVPLEQGCVRVLTYHRFGGSQYDPFSLDPLAFRTQLNWLNSNAAALTPNQFVQFVCGNADAIPAGSVMISIDDAHASVKRYALPELSRARVKALLFVCPGLIEDECHRSATSRRFMTWDELELARSEGHEIAPHGMTHRSLGQMPFAQAVDEIEAAREILWRRLQVNTPFFSFPFGTRLDYSEPLLRFLDELGYRICFSSIHGACIAASESNLYPRVKIEGGRESELFPHITRGCLDNWRLVDSLLYAVQQRGRL